MGVYILLFRGINVGGNKIVLMETLHGLLTEAGFGGVATYIQSGNVVLTSDKKEAAICPTIDSVFPGAFGFTSRPTVRSLAAWQRLIDENPFAKEGSADGRRVHAVVLDAAPAKDALKTLQTFATTEGIAVKDGVLYLHTPDGFGTSQVAKMLDRTLKVPMTARNWNTVLKLREMAEQLNQT